MANIHKLFGAPGCGKTTRLMAILMEELKTVPSERIAYVSFTRKGAYEGSNRAADQYNLKDKQMPYFRTLHSIAFRSGNYSKYDMISKRDYKKFSDIMGLRMTGFYTEEFFSNDDIYLFLHFLKRNNPQAGENYAGKEVNRKTLHDVEHNYKRYKEWAKVKDFTDIIEEFIAKGKALPVDVAIIDEAQDLTSLQWEMCQVAFRDCQRIYIAGDDDQAIYEWSGADVKYFLSLQADTTEILDKSYRLQSQGLEVSKFVAEKISQRVQKNFDPVGSEGSVNFYNSVKDITITDNESWYFLARNNTFLTSFKDLLMQRSKIFRAKDSLSYDPKIIEAIKLYEAVRKHESLKENYSLKLRLLFGDRLSFVQPWYEEIYLPNDTIAYYRDLFKFKTPLDREPLLHINTIHGVKGGEADNVVLALDFTKAVKMNMEHNPDSELRCLYVGLTRAKKHLHIINSQSKNGYGDYISLGGFACSGKN